MMCFIFLKYAKALNEMDLDSKRLGLALDECTRRHLGSSNVSEESRMMVKKKAMCNYRKIIVGKAKYKSAFSSKSLTCLIHRQMVIVDEPKI